jgi:hypothetical protein
MKKMGVLLCCLVLLGCNQRGKEMKPHWEARVVVLQHRLDSLQSEKDAAQSFIESAEIHQVTRPPEEKAQQLYNLNDHKSEIEKEIGAVKTLIGQYSDSIAGVEGQPQ